MTSNLSGNERQKPPCRCFWPLPLSYSSSRSRRRIPSASYRAISTGRRAVPILSPLSNLPQLGDENPVPVTVPLAVSGVEPKRIVIPAIGLDLPVQNIESRDINVLYENLKNGPIRYVDSARLGEEGNVLVFGHSSRIPVVKNRMYKAFNRVPELAAGDTITLVGEIDGVERSYLYSVVSVERKDIKDPTAVVSLAKEGRRLTLVTCDTLTGETARFVLEADFIGAL